jgi:hypothetical protein
MKSEALVVSPKDTRFIPGVSSPPEPSQLPIPSYYSHSMGVDRASTALTPTQSQQDTPGDKPTPKLSC